MTARLSPQREAETGAARKQIADLLWHSVPASDDVEATSITEDLLDKLVEAVRAERVERPADAIHYGIRLPDGAVLDGTVTDLAEQEARLARYRGYWPDAVLVQRDVFFGPWAEVTS